MPRVPNLLCNSCHVIQPLATKATRSATFSNSFVSNPLASVVSLDAATTARVRPSFDASFSLASFWLTGRTDAARRSAIANAVFVAVDPARFVEELRGRRGIEIGDRRFGAVDGTARPDRPADGSRETIEHAL